MENARLNGWQLFNMSSLFIIGTSFILLPGSLIADAKQYGWLVFVWAFLYGLVLAGFWLFLSSRFPGLSIVQIAVQVLGKWAGGLVSLLYILFFVQLASWVTRNLSDFMHVNLMPRTPPSIFDIMILLVCAYAVVKGIESIAMVSEFLGTYVNLAFWIPFSVMIKEWDWRNFNVPYAFQPWDTLIQTRYALAFPFMEIVAFMMIFPFVGRRLHVAFLSGISVAGILLSLCVFFSIGILGVERSSHLVYPVFIIFREMEITNFIDHLEAVISVNILLIVCIKLSLLFYCAVLAICQLFHVKERAVVAYPLVWIISAYSFFFESIVENVDWIRKYAFNYIAIYAIVIPAILIVCSWLRKKRQSQGRETAT
ncbi:GerAB/ArcD/ProY family transporter [Paenibacillus agricola]|uniref:Endospore germination permease n=1 Tax=Paenibacillus agricola TaxID=2716264 RepID=A0ABX0JGG0_9BACL|nr:endospore germination permease [Paenibacillus agricola]NHN33778.1 endospore germination permease [Paenibacillus agricola]